MLHTPACYNPNQLILVKAATPRISNCKWRTQTTQIGIWGSHGVEDVDVDPLGRDAVWTCTWVPLFRRSKLPPSAALKMKVVRSSETLAPKYKCTQLHHDTAHMWTGCVPFCRLLFTIWSRIYLVIDSTTLSVCQHVQRQITRWLMNTQLESIRQDAVVAYIYTWRDWVKLRTSVTTDGLRTGIWTWDLSNTKLEYAYQRLGSDVRFNVYLVLCKNLKKSQYSVWLRTGRPGFDPRQRQRISPLTGYRVFFPWGKGAAGAWCRPLTPL
jgi:hypothetical protein